MTNKMIFVFLNLSVIWKKKIFIFKTFYNRILDYTYKFTINIE